jgi:signal peptidase II
MRTTTFLTDRKKFIALTLISFFANYAADRVTKIIATRYLAGTPPLEFLGGCFVLVYSENRGAFLNMGESWNPAVKYLLLLVVPILVCLAGLIYLMGWEKKHNRIILLSTIIGGGMGNLVDRIVNNFSVMDFMNFGIGGLRTGILNVADLSVTFGTIFFVLCELDLFKKPETKNTIGGYYE